MDDSINICLKPVGVVESGIHDPDDMSVLGKNAVVEIFPEYIPALLRIEENSHLWLLLWFHQADRQVLSTAPRRINPDLPEFGVFGLRSPNRPNPIALTLVRLERVEGNRLILSGLDAVDGTPVLDIKSYYEGDIIFSPRTPHIQALDPALRRNTMLKQALAHHQESCPGLFMAVRMALAASGQLGHLNTPGLKVAVTGSACLADTLQGLTRARLANPARFEFREEAGAGRSVWESPGRRLTLAARQELDEAAFMQLADEALFDMGWEVV